MKIHAYVLAADPAWIEASVLSYYSLVDRIVVSFDSAQRGWTGAPIRVEECLERLRALDREGKMRYAPGTYARSGYTPMENETHQRQEAVRIAGVGADWVLQLDTDEVLPNPGALRDLLREAAARNVPAVEWPMRVLFRRQRSGQFLEVCAPGGRDRYEYPGPVAVRPEVTFVGARRTGTSFLRPIVRGDCVSLQVCAAPAPGEQRLECLEPGDAVVHNSWARTPESIRRKIGSWGHSAGYRSWLFYYTSWRPAARLWPLMRDFHPFARGLWPRLKPCTSLPSAIARQHFEQIT